MSRHPATRRPGQHGLTLVEACIAVAITCILLAGMLPSMQQLRQRQHLHGLAAQLETDLHLARSEAVARNRIVRLAFAGSGAQACWAIHTGNPGACSCQSGQCSAGGELLATRSVAASPEVSVSSNSTSLAFSPRHGTVTPTATMRVRHSGGDEVRLVINLTGRVRSCTPTAGLTAFQPLC